MTDETTQEIETVETDDYFSSHSELIDDHGEAISDTKADPASKQVEAPKEAVKPVESKVAPAATVDGSKSYIPYGFFGSFFDKDVKGAVNLKS
jgi:hypothetical protein